MPILLSRTYQADILIYQEDWYVAVVDVKQLSHSELRSEYPQPKSLAKSFKALVWGVSVSCKATIEKLVSDAVDLLGTQS